MGNAGFDSGGEDTGESLFLFLKLKILRVILFYGSSAGAVGGQG